MTTLQAEVHDAFRSLDVSDDKALNAAIALSLAFEKRDADTGKSFDKRDADIEAIQKDLTLMKADVSGIYIRLASQAVEINLLKWMTGTSIGIGLTVLFRVFTHS